MIRLAQSSLGIATGLAVGLIVNESLLAAMEFMTAPDRSIRDALHANAPLARGDMLGLIAAWTLAAACTAAMTRGLSGQTLVGILAGLCWLFPAILTAGLGHFADWAFHAAWLGCLIGTAGGTALAIAAEPAPLTTPPPAEP